MNLKAMLICFLLSAPVAPTGICQEKADKPGGRSVESGAGPRADPKTFKDKRGPDFSVSAVADSPILFTITLSDRTNGGSVTSMYNRNQLALIQAILRESTDFARTEEAVGARRPQTTRFFNEEERSFFVDVSKLGKASQFFVSMKSRNGYITVDCGTIRRGAASAERPFVETILAKIIEATATK